MKNFFNRIICLKRINLVLDSYNVICLFCPNRVTFCRLSILSTTSGSFLPTASHMDFCHRILSTPSFAGGCKTCYVCTMSVQLRTSSFSTASFSPFTSQVKEWRILLLLLLLHRASALSYSTHSDKMKLEGPPKALTQKT